MRERVSRALVPALLALVICAVLAAPLVGVAMFGAPAKTPAPDGVSWASVTPTPTSTLTTITAVPGLAGWARADVTATITATDHAGGANLSELWWRVTPPGTVTTQSAETTTFVITTEGTTTIDYFATSGPVAESTKTATVRIDKSAPVVSVTATASYANTATVPVSVADTHSGVASISYRLDNAATQTVAAAATTIGPVVTLGAHTLRVWATDVAGNVSAETTRAFTVLDTQPPVSSFAATPAADWASTNVTVTITATDTAGSGVTKIAYWLNTGVETTYTAPFLISSEGTTSVDYRARDASGNVEATKTASVKIDKTPPAAPQSLSYSSLTDTSVALVWQAATDAHSGVAHYEVFNGASRMATTTARAASLTTLTAGTQYTLGVRAIDKAGNIGQFATLTITTPGAGSSVPVGAGASIPVTLAVSAGGLSGSGVASVTITNVSVPGVLKLFRAVQTPAPAPGTLRFMGDDYELSFTGTFTGTATVTLPYDARIPANRAAALRVLHWTGFAWETLVPVVDPVSHTVTFALKSLSPLSLAEPAATNTTATITFTKTAVYATFGSSPLATARMVDASGTPLPGFTLVLQRFVNGVWADFATMAPVAGDPGAYRANATPYQGVRTTFRVRLDANPLYTAGAPKMRVIPRAKLSAPRPSMTSVGANRTFYLSGTMLPKRATTVRMEIYRRNGSRYAYVTYKSVKTSAGGSYRTSMKLSKGTYKFRTRVGANTYSSMNALTYSPYSVKVRVR